jgi:hypothetical protein
MLIEQALRYHLANTGAITALVGTRVYGATPSQITLTPYITTQKISQVPDVITFGKRYVNTRMQISVYGVTEAAIMSVAALLFLALDKFSGTMGGVGGVNVVNSTFSNETALGKEDAQDLYGVAADYIFNHELTISNT